MRRALKDLRGMQAAGLEGSGACLIMGMLYKRMIKHHTYIHVIHVRRTPLACHLHWPCVGLFTLWASDTCDCGAGRLLCSVGQS